MVVEKYEFNSHGPTIQEVETSLRSQRENLVDKLAKAKASVELRLDSPHYEGRFRLRGKCKQAACMTDFRVESDVGFASIQEQAIGRVGGTQNLQAYDAEYKCRQSVALTDVQAKALKPKDTGAYSGEIGLSRAIKTIDGLRI